MKQRLKRQQYETKTWFFEKINKIDKLLARLTKIKTENAQINKIRNKKEVTTDITEIQRILREYSELLYTNKLDNLQEMDKILESHNFPRLIHEETENLNKLITTKEIETVIKNITKNRSPGPDKFSGEFYHSKKNLRLFQKTEDKGMLPNIFYEASTTLIPKPDKNNTQKRKLQANV